MPCPIATALACVCCIASIKNGRLMLRRRPGVQVGFGIGQRIAGSVIGGN